MAFESAFHAFGYNYVYIKKLQRLNSLVKVVKVLGILVPVLIGAFFMAYSSNQEVLKWVVWIAAPLSIVQLVFSTILAVNGSEENIIAYGTKAAEYSVLNHEFFHLGKFPDDDYKELLRKYEVLAERMKGVSKGIKSLNESDLRKGMRYALRNYKKECVACKEIPYSMKPTNCDVCGNF